MCPSPRSRDIHGDAPRRELRCPRPCRANQCRLRRGILAARRSSVGCSADHQHNAPACRHPRSTTVREIHRGFDVQAPHRYSVIERKLTKWRGAHEASRTHHCVYRAHLVADVDSSKQTAQSATRRLHPPVRGRCATTHRFGGFTAVATGSALRVGKRTTFRRRDALHHFC